MAYLINIDYKNFLIRRLLRIYPIYIIAVLISYLIIFIVNGEIGSIDWRALSLLPLNTLTNPINYPLGIEWTLVYEVFFYFICALFASNKNGKKYFLFFLIIWFFTILVANQFDIISKNLRIQDGSLLIPSWQWIFFSPKNLLFICGGIGYYIYKEMQHIESRFLFFQLIISWMLFSYAMTLGAHGLFATIVMSISFTLLIIVLSVAEKNSKSIISSNYYSNFIKYFSNLGDYSYGLYLIHVTLLVAFVKVTIDFVLPNFYSSLIYALSAFGIVFLLGYFFGKFDLKVHKYIQNIYSKKKRN